MTIVVTGATGNVGRPLVAELMRAGVRVRAVTRNPAAARLPDGVDLTSSARDALSGATAVFLNSRALGADLAAVVKEAGAQGVSKLVALSASNVDDDFARQPSRFRGDRNKEAEQLAVDSGLTWVSLRPTMFDTNFAGMWSGQLRAGDVVAGPYADASSAPIAEADIAAVAARALLTDELDGQRITLTGPQALTNAELLAALGGALGRRLRYVEAPADAVHRQFLSLGFPAAFADGYLAIMADAVVRPALVTGDVEKILGRPAQSFSAWAAEHTDLF